MSTTQTNYREKPQCVFADHCLREQPTQYPDPALQSSIETLILQSISQLFQQLDFVPYLTKDHKTTVLKNLKHLKNECEIVLNDPQSNDP